MTILLTIAYIAVCFFLIMVVLLQSGKRADLAGAFGGGSSQTAFGARGAATTLAKATTASAVLFMILALALSMLYSRPDDQGSVLDEVDAAAGSPAPIGAPAEPAPAIPQQEAPTSSVPDEGSTDGPATRPEQP